MVEKNAGKLDLLFACTDEILPELMAQLAATGENAAFQFGDPVPPSFIGLFGHIQAHADFYRVMLVKHRDLARKKETAR